MILPIIAVIATAMAIDSTVVVASIQIIGTTIIAGAATVVASNGYSG